MTTLIEVATHGVIDAVFGPDSEQIQARDVLGSLGSGMLLLADRNYRPRNCGTPSPRFRWPPA